MSQIHTVTIKQKSPEIDRVIPHGAMLEELATGFKWAEGPIWIPDKDELVFSDVSGNAMYKWKPSKRILGSGRSTTSIFRQPSGYANGNTLDRQNRLVSCEHANRRVSRTESDGSVVTLCSHFEGKKLNSPNDIVVRSDGSIYFTDPPDGLTADWGVPGVRELDFQGVYRLRPNTTKPILEVADFQTPNGLAFSPDERTLYIDDTDRQHVRAFDVAHDGSLSNGRVFTEFEYQPRTWLARWDEN